MTVDGRLLSEEGRKQIAKDYEKSKKIIDTVDKIANTKDITIADFFNELEKSSNMQDTIQNIIENNPEIAKTISQNPNESLSKNKIAIQVIAIAILNEYGYSLENIKFLNTEEKGQGNKNIKGFVTTQNDNIYLNLKNINTMSDMLKTLGQEIAGFTQNKEGIDITANREEHNKYQDMVAEDLINDVKFVLSNSKYSNISDKALSKANSIEEYLEIIKNNSEFSELDKELGDNLTFEEIEQLEKLAENGHEGAIQTLAEYKNAIEKEKLAVDLAKELSTDPQFYKELIKELSGYNDLVNTVGNILNGDYTDASLAALGIVAKKVPAGKQIVDKVEEALAISGKKIAKIDGKIYGKNKNGDVVEVKEYNVDEFKINQKNSAVGDNLDNHHVPQKDIAKKNVDGYPTDKNSQTAPSILIDKRLHSRITAMQNSNKVARNKMTPRELLADDAKMLREIGVPNNKIKEIIESNKQKYGFKKGE